LSLNLIGDMVKEEKELFFVKIEDTAPVRRGLLEGLRDVVDVLQKYDAVKGIRERKIHKMQELRSHIKEINKLLYRLKAAFPHIKVKVPKLGKKESPGKQKKASVPQAEKLVPPPKKKTELDMLEDELTAIENKLKGLA